METIGIRDLKVRASEILRRVRETGTAYEVTYHGRAIARLVPIHRPANHESVEEFLKSLDQVADEIGSHWPPGVSAVEAVREVRRDL